MVEVNGLRAIVVINLVPGVFVDHVWAPGQSIIGVFKDDYAVFCFATVFTDHNIRISIRIEVGGSNPLLPIQTKSGYRLIFRSPECLFLLVHRSPDSDLCYTPLEVVLVLKLALFGFELALFFSAPQIGLLP